jgi:hypothetical protein
VFGAEEGEVEYNSSRETLLAWLLAVVLKLDGWTNETIYFQPLPAEACPHEPPPLVLG